MNTDPRTLIDDLLAYALRFAESNDEPATGDCWAVIERARHYLRESANRDQSRETAPSAPASGAVPGIPSLEALCAGGLTIGECIRAFAVPGDDPYVSAARATIDADDDTEIDDHTTTSVGDGGAWVLAWLWISDAQAGVLSHSAMLEEVLVHARKALTRAYGLDVETARLRENQADWLEDLLSNYADEVDDVASARPESEPSAILWVDGEGRDVLFAPSDALLHLLALARQAGLRERAAEHCERFCAQHGSTLDAVLVVVQIG